MMLQKDLSNIKERHSNGKMMLEDYINLFAEVKRLNEALRKSNVTIARLKKDIQIMRMTKQRGGK